MTIKYKCDTCSIEAPARGDAGLPPLGWAEKLEFAAPKDGDEETEVVRSGTCVSCVDQTQPVMRAMQMIRKFHGAEEAQRSAAADRTRAIVGAADKLVKRFTRYVQPEELDSWRIETSRDYDALVKAVTAGTDEQNASGGFVA